ncbi:hypothetical protein PR048_014984 [Dryococelus australis]|uniref:Uncharacterized protein n=1 Tax=Dryococelus australis TaxID=614101 RepID=A0ABQ9HFU5_9NEOP|nr:hypothetical protein PR048_014984 [Dryococelus australis]
METIIHVLLTLEAATGGGNTGVGHASNASPAAPCCHVNLLLLGGAQERERETDGKKKEELHPPLRYNRGPHQWQQERLLSTIHDNKRGQQHERIELAEGLREEWTTSRGAAVVKWLDCSPPTNSNRVPFQVVSPLPLPNGFRIRESWQTIPLLGAFSRGSPVYPSLHSGAATYSPRFTLIGSQDLVVKSRLNLRYTPQTLVMTRALLRENREPHQVRHLGKPTTGADNRDIRRSPCIAGWVGSSIVHINEGSRVLPPVQCRGRTNLSYARSRSFRALANTLQRRERRRANRKPSSSVCRRNERHLTQRSGESGLLPPLPRYEGAMVAEWLACSPLTKMNRAQFPAGSPDFGKWESCPTMPLVGGPSLGLPHSPPPGRPSGTQPPSPALKTSLLRATQIEVIYVLPFSSFPAVGQSPQRIVPFITGEQATRQRTIAPCLPHNRPTGNYSVNVNNGGWVAGCCPWRGEWALTGLFHAGPGVVARHCYLSSQFQRVYSGDTRPLSESVGTSAPCYDDLTCPYLRWVSALVRPHTSRSGTRMRCGVLGTGNISESRLPLRRMICLHCAKPDGRRPFGRGTKLTNLRPARAAGICTIRHSPEEIEQMPTGLCNRLQALHALSFHSSTIHLVLRMFAFIVPSCKFSHSFQSISLPRPFSAACSIPSSPKLLFTRQHRCSCALEGLFIPASKEPSYSNSSTLHPPTLDLDTIRQSCSLPQWSWTHSPSPRWLFYLKHAVYTAGEICLQIKQRGADTPGPSFLPNPLRASSRPLHRYHINTVFLSLLGLLLRARMQSSREADRESTPARGRQSNTDHS